MTLLRCRRADHSGVHIIDMTPDPRQIAGYRWFTMTAHGDIKITYRVIRPSRGWRRHVRREKAK